MSRCSVKIDGGGKVEALAVNIDGVGGHSEVHKGDPVKVGWALEDCRALDA